MAQRWGTVHRLHRQLAKREALLPAGAKDALLDRLASIRATSHFQIQSEVITLNYYPTVPYC